MERMRAFAALTFSVCCKCKRKTVSLSLNHKCKRKLQAYHESELCKCKRKMVSVSLCCKCIMFHFYRASMKDKQDSLGSLMRYHFEEQPPMSQLPHERKAQKIDEGYKLCRYS